MTSTKEILSLSMPMKECLIPDGYYHLRTYCSITTQAISWILLIILISGSVMAQVQSTDIYLGNYSYSEGRLKVERLRNVTNRDGYDNQVCFHDSKPWFYYSSIRNDEQSDIYRFEWDKRRSYRVTETPESEYSPKLIPEKGQISVVRVETDKKQRVWSFDSRNPESVYLITEYIDNVGYYVRMSESEMLLFQVASDGASHKLIRHNYINGKRELIDSRIGRFLDRRPDSLHYSYVSKSDSSHWKIIIYDSESRSKVLEFPTLDQEEDYCWLDSKYLISGKGNRLFAMNIEEKREWVEIQDLSEVVRGEIQRIAIQPAFGKIALVVKREP